MRKRFETLQEKKEKGTPNDEYENFVNAHLGAAAECIPKKTRTKYRVPWEKVVLRKTSTRENCLQKQKEETNKDNYHKTKKGHNIN